VIVVKAISTELRVALWELLYVDDLLVIADSEDLIRKLD